MKNVLLNNNLFFRIIMGLILVQIIGITICYSQAKNDILEVKYRILKTDYYLNGEETSYQDFAAVLAENNVAYKKWKSGRTLKAVGNIIIVPSVAFMTLGVANLNNDNEIASGLAPLMMLGGLGGAILGVILVETGKNKTISAINTFNSENRVRVNLLNNGANLGVIINLNKKKN